MLINLTQRLCVPHRAFSSFLFAFMPAFAFSFSVFLRFTVFFFLFLTVVAVPAAHSAQSAQAKLFITRPPTPSEIKARDTHGKFEPAIGCYLGAFIDFDPSLKSPVSLPITDLQPPRQLVLPAKNNFTNTPDRSKQTAPKMAKHQDPAAFETLVQKPHAIYFFYVGYGHPVPFAWIRWLGEHGKLVHVALEPNDGLKKVQDDAYLSKLADGFASTGAKIFLRFGSEMNGDWVSYYHDPAEFRAKFRLVHHVMHKRAPNVAMVWCPYTPYQVHLPLPFGRIEDYYPGDDGTDWVGVNMYSVTYHNNNLNFPGENEHPCDLLAEVYDRYAARKPFMICEFAATHYVDCEKKTRADFATRKIETLYMALPRLFPRVKAINYFDSNNIQFTDHVNNDYSVTNDANVLNSYHNCIRSPYFIERPQPTPAPPFSAAIPMPLRKGELLRGTVEISCFARAPGDRLRVRYKIDGYQIYTADQPLLWTCLWDAGSVKPGRHTLSLEVYDIYEKRVASQTLSVLTAR